MMGEEGVGGEMEETWRGSSIAQLRRKAIEHTVHMTNVNGYRL